MSTQEQAPQNSDFIQKLFSIFQQQNNVIPIRHPVTGEVILMKDVDSGRMWPIKGEAGRASSATNDNSLSMSPIFESQRSQVPVPSGILPYDPQSPERNNIIDLAKLLGLDPAMANQWGVGRAQDTDVPEEELDAGQRLLRKYSDLMDRGFYTRRGREMYRESKNAKMLDRYWTSRGIDPETHRPY